MLTQLLELSPCITTAKVSFMFSISARGLLSIAGGTSISNWARGPLCNSWRLKAISRPASRLV